MINAMARLGAKERAKLPDKAFAYVDATGKRRLPIHDAAHVRNALSRFGQVHFEDEAARDRARMRLLRAAQQHGIMPIGFIRAELQPLRKLPTGQVTFLMTDLENSTGLLARLGDAYGKVLADVRKRIRAAVRREGGREVDARADEHFAAFADAHCAVRAAVAVQRDLAADETLAGLPVRVRIGLHHGRPTLTETGYVGIAVHAAARISFAAHGGQVVASSAVEQALGNELPDDLTLQPLGTYRFQGLPEALGVFQVDAEGVATDFPPLRSGIRID